jgi:ATP-binding cassette subfamily B protein
VENALAAGDFDGDDKRRRSLKPLRGLFPYLVRYKSLVGGVVFFLMLAAATIL